jgi:hypothetical protein
MRALVFALVLVTGQSGSAVRPDEKELPKALPDTIVKAWKDAGATVGWIKVDTAGVPTFVEKAEAGAIPAFRFAGWKDGVVAKLPAPGSAFGLDLARTEITDEGLKELANFKHLSTLTLCETKVTDGAVESLQKALPKCFIFNC